MEARKSRSRSREARQLPDRGLLRRARADGPPRNARLAGRHDRQVLRRDCRPSSSPHAHAHFARWRWRAKARRSNRAASSTRRERRWPKRKRSSMQLQAATAITGEPVVYGLALALFTPGHDRDRQRRRRHDRPARRGSGACCARSLPRAMRHARPASSTPIR